jgi:hypothetical protein
MKAIDAFAGWRHVSNHRMIRRAGVEPIRFGTSFDAVARRRATLRRSVSGVRGSIAD